MPPPKIRKVKWNELDVEKLSFCDPKPGKIWTVGITYKYPDGSIAPLKIQTPKMILSRIQEFFDEKENKKTISVPLTMPGVFWRETVDSKGEKTGAVELEFMEEFEKSAQFFKLMQKIDKAAFDFVFTNWKLFGLKYELSSEIVKHKQYPIIKTPKNKGANTAFILPKPVNYDDYYTVFYDSEKVPMRIADVPDPAGADVICILDMGHAWYGTSGWGGKMTLDECLIVEYGGEGRSKFLSITVGDADEELPASFNVGEFDKKVVKRARVEEEIETA